MQYFHFLKIARLNAYYTETHNYNFQNRAIMIKVNPFITTFVQRPNSSLCPLMNERLERVI